MGIYIGLGLQLIVQVIVLSFFYGRFVERVKAIDLRVDRIEKFIDSFLRGMIRVDFAPQFPAKLTGKYPGHDPSKDQKG